jgi:CHASE3 domain sensor protein
MFANPIQLERTSPALILGLLLALAVFVGNEWAYQRAQESINRWRGHDNADQAVQLVLRRLVDAESSQRGYLLTERKDYLVPGFDAQRDIGRAIAQLRVHYRASPQLMPLIDTLADRADEKLAELNETVTLHDTGRQAAALALVMTDIGREKMQAVRTAATTLLAHARDHAATERAKVLRTLDAGRLGIHTAMMLSLLFFVHFLRKSAALQEEQRSHARDLLHERERLETQVRARTQDLSGLNDRLQLVREEERQRVARALHDELGAILTAAKLDMARVRHLLDRQPTEQTILRLDHLAATLDQGIRLKRRIMEELMPSALHNLGLREALEGLADDFCARTGIATARELSTVEMGESSRVIAYRWVEGVLHHIEQRGQATSLRIGLNADGPDRIQVSVHDSAGDAQAASAALHGDNMIGLRNRIEGLGGTVIVRTLAGQGSEMLATLPLHAHARSTDPLGDTSASGPRKPADLDHGA